MKLNIGKRFIVFPISEKEQFTSVKLSLQGVDHLFTAKLTNGEAEYYAYFDALLYLGIEASISDADGEDIPFMLTDSVPRKLGPIADPIYHFKAPTGWVNDPNGLNKIGDIYHMFYQSNPYGLYWGNKHWGHAVSRNLYDWSILPYAIYPDKNGVSISGSSYFGAGHGQKAFDNVSDSLFIAAYTSRSGNYQAQSLAVSYDSGLSWNKCSKNPVLKPETDVDFRDPKLTWNDENKEWSIVLASGKKFSFFVSKDLVTWEKSSDFSDDSHDYDTYECPDLLRFNTEDGEKWVLLGSMKKCLINDYPGMIYFVGKYDGKAFTAEEGPFSFDFGKDFYAAIAWPCGRDNVYEWIGWLNNWSYAQKTPIGDWRGMMTIPREVILKKTNTGFRLFQSPHPCMAAAHITCSDYNPSEINCCHAFDIPAAADIEIYVGTQSSYDLSLSTECGEKVVISVNPENSTIVCDRSGMSCGLDSEAFLSPDILHADELFKKPSLYMRLFVDTSSLEILFDEGQYAITQLLLPTALISKLEISKNADIEILKISQLRPAENSFGTTTQI